MEWDFIKLHKNDGYGVVFDGYFGTAYSDGDLKNPLCELETIILDQNEYIKLKDNEKSLRERISFYQEDSLLDEKQLFYKHFRQNRLIYISSILFGIDKMEG